MPETFFNVLTYLMYLNYQVLYFRQRVAFDTHIETNLNTRIVP